MTNRMLAGFADVTLSAVPAEGAVPPPDYLARCRELAAGYHMLQQQLPQERPLRAYLLFDAWEGNPLAAELSEQWPEAVSGREAVPDDFYAGREDEAPCLVPVPDDLLLDADSDSLVQARAQEALARWLEDTSKQASQRLARQYLCAVLFSPESAIRVAQHLALLGFQYVPGSHTARLFRYQDPRVMQRVWPTLSAEQQNTWLGKTQAWWSLTQPWGPIADLSATEDSVTPAPVWFKAQRCAASAVPATVPPLNRLMNATQWQAAHSSPVGNRVWARFAQRGIAAQTQPNAASMTRLLDKGQELGLVDSNLQDFIWCSWRPILQSVQDGIVSKPIDWDAPLWRDVLARVLQALRDDPDAGFASLFEDREQFA
ncbi:DUF4123 domain-containing protein [Ralstonia insidiosa]|uniref:DUF4123 domain-containing protein n=1 Tax=Ralstonia insidiosa TaxID=190721 RepID=A0A192A4Y3_9RALS|nr:DUF4123 domain-containing protein [Ralstonia insidiosa]ANJ75403.1 hypothetical protein A9Y76_23180 [Ralstonia insidiosa]MBY4910518.1 DUF4123 domain-containing protein [Ralstonia insidiosa]